MSPTEYVYERINNLEADLEELRPIAEQHPIAEVKHIGLREIPQAVKEVFADVKAQRDELLEACQAMEDKLDYLCNLWGAEGVTRSLIQKLDAAIAKAQPEPVKVRVAE